MLLYKKILLFFYVVFFYDSFMILFSFLFFYLVFFFPGGCLVYSEFLKLYKIKRLTKIKSDFLISF